ncbi:MAG: 2,3,4,5-tetrahydropyridine-2,6-dicarboxylate N-succinyltransferase [Proteobacteria bacterium]|nr:2,3,4,5-tetrahydropyridine-2,6-dicarboxylate N-succinyltransferase [Pseudomonadota bacterium]
MSDFLTSGATGEGYATVSRNGVVLDAWFPEARLAPAGGQAATMRLHHSDVEGYARTDDIRRVEIVPIRTGIASLQDAPVDVHDAYLRLHLLSLRQVRPNTVNLDNIFQLIPTVAWTTLGPCTLDDLDEARIEARIRGVGLDVKGIDKIPRMTDYVVPGGVRIADAGRVRLGAYLAEGTMVMHEGFCNYNAGTLGACMVEGRISQGIVVGAGSDIGGGASLMGTLSGGGKEKVSVGERCLIGANAGLGIALGDDCVIEAGCYLTAGALVKLEDGRTVKARELSGQSGLLFWRNSRTGGLEAIKRKKVWGGLNPQLHAKAS